MKRNTKFEEIILDNIRFRRYPESIRREDRSYYKGYYNKKRITLHRYVWEKEFGNIPEKHIIHHLDNNTLNNKINNLVCIERGKHQSEHLKEPERIKLSRKTIEVARIYASKWHGSKAGLQFHKKLGKLSWKNKIKYKKECTFCNKNYKTYFPSRSKFCSTSCKSKNRNFISTYKDIHIDKK